MGQDTPTEALTQRLFEACIGALDLLHVYLGDRLGLYAVLAAHGPLTAGELAERAAIDPRYAREWLEQQAVAGILRVEDGVDSATRRFALPPGHAEALLSPDSLSLATPFALGVAGVAQALPHVLNAFRTGEGVRYEVYGDDLRNCVSRMNRPAFVSLLANEWFSRVPSLVEMLEAEPAARVADVGCGTGWSSIAIARGFPRASVLGLDLDERSVVEAQSTAASSGVADRVRFEVRDAADPQLAGDFQLVCAFETIHDMCDPVGGLRAMRQLRSEGGTVLVVDERVAETFTTDVEDGERFLWGWSALHCLPCAMSAPPAAGTGTIMRAPILHDYALAAGFGDVKVLPIENDFWRFYELSG
jgi:SAM-dependent methyltransferase